ncbi:hypothetical protein [Streptomyces sp. NPDC059513]|uniref:hypothetical protein n=1 Tax=unclassified Streptomyces TaxID=2593676 RepID=UPI0036955BA6
MNSRIFSYLVTHMMNVYCLSLGLLSTLWGLVLLVPFGTFGNNNLAQYMSAIAPEPVWGMVAILAGLVMGIGTLKKKRRVVKVGLMTGFLVWGFVFLTYFISLPYSTAVVTSGFIVWAHVMPYLTLSGRPDSLDVSY